MYETQEYGPLVNSIASGFSLPDHNQVYRDFDTLMGSSGILLGFIGDIWQPTSVRRILWLQRHIHKFALMGTPVTLMVHDHPHTLYGFHMSSPVPMPFPLLADTDGQVHEQYNMTRYPGLLLIDHHRLIREKWLMPDDNVWPRMPELVRAVQMLQAFA